MSKKEDRESKEAICKKCEFYRDGYCKIPGTPEVAIWLIGDCSRWHEDKQEVEQ